LENQNALKVNITLVSMYQQPTGGEELLFHVPSGTKQS